MTARDEPWPQGAYSVLHLRGRPVDGLGSMAGEMPRETPPQDTAYGRVAVLQVRRARCSR